MWEKKVSLFSLLSFCFVKLDLRVWEDSWEKVVEKWMISWIRLETCLCLKRWYCQGNWQQKSEERILASFSSYNMRSFYPTFFLQQFLKLMSKMGKYDGSSCIAKLLNFGSQSFKMLEFTPWNDLLLSHGQHFWFPKNAFSESDFEKMLDAVFMRPQNFGTKFKIQKKLLTICWIALVAA